jgi:hypothetical protein
MIYEALLQPTGWHFLDGRCSQYNVGESSIVSENDDDTIEDHIHYLRSEEWEVSHADDLNIVGKGNRDAYKCTREDEEMLILIWKE